MSSEKTQMVDLLSSSTKKSLTIKNFSKDGFLIDNKLHNYSILISSENIHTYLDILSKMSKLSIAVEIMTTPSACSTWNILISEGRRAFACLKLK